MTFDPYSGQRQFQPPVVETGPLAGLQGQVAAVLNAADPHRQYVPGPDGSMLTYARPQQPSVIGAALRGALYGLAATLLWRRVRGHRAGRHRPR
jgi:hypothetical protein